MARSAEGNAVGGRAPADRVAAVVTSTRRSRSARGYMPHHRALRVRSASPATPWRRWLVRGAVATRAYFAQSFGSGVATDQDVMADHQNFHAEGSLLSSHTRQYCRARAKSFPVLLRAASR